MDIFDRIKAIRTSLKLSQAAFGERIGVSRGAINNLDRKVVTPSDLFIQHLCDIYRVHEHWLRTGEGSMFKTEEETIQDFLVANFGLNETALHIAEQFAQLDNKTQVLVRDLIDALLDKRQTAAKRKQSSNDDETNTPNQPQKIEPPRAPNDDENPDEPLPDSGEGYIWEMPHIEEDYNPMRRIPRISRIAAGPPITAVDLSDENDYVEVPANSRADVAFEVAGDSMEPDFPDGCTVLVRLCDQGMHMEPARIGDLVIALHSEFGSDPEATFKILRRQNGNVVLEAINDAYDDIVFPADQVRIYGTVLGILEEEEDDG